MSRPNSQGHRGCGRKRTQGSIRPHAKGYRCAAGKVRGGNGKLVYKRFWLGHDRFVAERLASAIAAEWRLHKLHGHDAWTAEALARIERKKRELYDPPSEIDWLGPTAPASMPGSRKSGLTLQIAIDLARRGHRVLFVLTEEPGARLLERALRMMSGWPEEQVRQTLANLLVEENLGDIEALPNFLILHVLSPAGRFHGASMLCLDSIQGHGLAAGASQKWQRLYEAFRLCQKAKITTIAVCHFTKRNEVAGPRNLQHNVDAILVLRQVASYRLLFVPKNRGGPASLRHPAMLLLDSVTLTLRPSPHSTMMTAVARTFLGAQLGEAEVQCSVGLTSFGSRGRVIAPHLPKRELEQLVETISRIDGFEIDALDFQINCRLPGERAYKGVLGLAISLALVSSFLQKPIPASQMQVGEVDLLRRVRDLPEQVLSDLDAALVAGQIPTPLRILCPPSAARTLTGAAGVEVIACGGIDDAIFQTWPDLR